MMDTVDNGYHNVTTVKWIMVLLYAHSAITLLQGISEPTRAMPVENL